MDQVFCCALCDERFYTKRVLKNHIVNKHGGGIKCTICDKGYRTNYNLKRHIKNVHETRKPVFLVSGSKFECKDGVLNVTVTPLTVTGKKVTCSQCDRSFRDSYNLKNHVKRVHEHTCPRKLVHCTLCDTSLNMVEMSKHYTEDHDISIEYELLSFGSFNDFLEWKNKLEMSTQSRYVKHCAPKRNKDGNFVHHYRCFRDGKFRDQSSGVKTKSKVMGSNKLGGWCPAKITAKVDPNGIVAVSFCRTHVGHDKELERLSLSKSDREAIAEEIRANRDFKEIIDDIRSRTDPSMRIHHITRKDLYNIAREFHLDVSKRRKVKNETVVESSVEDLRVEILNSFVRVLNSIETQQQAEAVARIIAPCEQVVSSLSQGQNVIFVQEEDEPIHEILIENTSEVKNEHWGSDEIVFDVDQ